MTKREQIARAMMERAKRGDLFFDMSMAVREAALDNMLPAFEALADIALDCLTAPPSPAMLAAAMEPYKNDRAMQPTHGIKSAGQLPAAHLILTAWEAMVRAMIEEGKNG